MGGQQCRDLNRRSRARLSELPTDDASHSTMHKDLPRYFCE